MKVLRLCGDLLDPLEVVAKSGNVNSLSDAGVAAHAVQAAASGALLNVLINVATLTDRGYAVSATDEALATREMIRKRASAIAEDVEARIRSS